MRLPRWWSEAASEYRESAAYRSMVRTFGLYIALFAGLMWYFTHDSHTVRVSSSGQAFTCTPVQP